MENNNDQKCFGENIFLLRKVHRLSQKELAKIMGVSVYCVRKAEQGVFANSLCADALVNLSRHFRLRISTLLAPQEEWNITMLFKGEEEQGQE